MASLFSPFEILAHTSGPSQPEFNSFTPIGTSDMVDLASGDFNYNIPVMDVGGYPLNLSYNSGITMDQQASWVGLGWNLNVGHIDRSIRGLPDDFNGDNMIYENNMRDNITVGSSFNISGGFAGIESLGIKGSFGITATYNNYNGISFQPQAGIGFPLSENINVGFNLSNSVAEGASVSPRIGLSQELKGNERFAIEETSIGIAHNSRQGMSNLMLQSNGLGSDSRGQKSGGGGSVGLTFNDPTFTPNKRAALFNESFSFSAAIAGTFILVDGQTRIDGFGSYQKLQDDEIRKSVPSYGYENTAEGLLVDGILDFNRENDKTFNKNTTVIPVPNYTYDVYSINGQGINGAFRPFHSQVQYIGDKEIKDVGNGSSFGARFGGGNAFYSGIKALNTSSISQTGTWDKNNFAKVKFEPTNNTNLLYEDTYFQVIGETVTDSDPNFFNVELLGDEPINLKLDGKSHDRQLVPVFETDNGSTSYNISTANIKRDKRSFRNQVISKITNEEAAYDQFIVQRSSILAEPHHTVGIKVLQPDGSRYNFGQSAYNIKKIENTFDVSAIASSEIDCSTGTVNLPQTVQNRSDLDVYASGSSDAFRNTIITPAYAHSFLLTSVLSADYEDIDENGPSLNDLGSYTKFIYKTYNSESNPYRWRLPNLHNKAYFNEGLKTNPNDQKASYIYGEKEQMYIQIIETKTHVAYFELSDRFDARGASGELKVEATAPMAKKISRIYLFSRPEFEQFRSRIEDGSEINDPTYQELGKDAIKIAHFEYDYDLCKGIPDNFNDDGKLTLKKVFFTYRGSEMGRYTPYVFNYDSLNPNYNEKSFDTWGNFKPLTENAVSYDQNGEVYISDSSNSLCKTTDPLTTPEFPYTLQEDRELQGKLSSAWTLTSINLPSGGKMELDYESDDYQFVQDKRAMEMYKVIGAGNEPIPSTFNNRLYNGRDHQKYIYVKIKNGSSDVTEMNEIKSDFVEEYLNGKTEDPIQFNFLLNMIRNSPNKYDYVSGYFQLDDLPLEVFSDADATYASLPLKFLSGEGGFVTSSYEVNPIAKAGWYFGRTYLNKFVYGLNKNGTNKNFVPIVKDLVKSIPGILKIFSGPNFQLQQNDCAKEFNQEKSWIRLYDADHTKLGGGVRVKKLKIYDNWDIMTDNEGNAVYSQTYGQEYSYQDENGLSSGVASFEPNSNRENPFIQPFYDEEGNTRDKLLAPREFNFTEKPFGKSFFPGSKVTYSRVVVNNLEKTRDDGTGNELNIGKHGTGHVVHEFYTTKDFPTKINFTTIKKEYDKDKVGLGDLLGTGVKEKNHLTLSQGFYIETNNMDGKPKKQLVFPEGKSEAISGINYIYSLKDDGSLNNKLATINEAGEVLEKPIGISLEAINDFRQNKSELKMAGVDANLSVFFVAIFPGIAPVPLPQSSYHDNKVSTAATLKVVNKTGVLLEKNVFDLGSTVKTKNVVWDSEDGSVRVTKTNNEYDDFYYNFTLPAKWAYRNMGSSSQNLGVIGTLNPIAGNSFFTIQEDLGNNREIFTEGDELLDLDSFEKYWVVAIDETRNRLQIMDKYGSLIDQCGEGDNLNIKIIRSGFRNMNSEIMASQTSLLHPFDLDNDGVLEPITNESFVFTSQEQNDPKILQANAILYNDLWSPQAESGLPKYPNEPLINNGSDSNFYFKVNPYIFNIKGNWRPKASYAYLTSRSSWNEKVQTRQAGFFEDYQPFYVLNSTWNASGMENNPKWTFASEVSQLNPYGVEIENKDALGRYSSAQYGYNYTLPTAVASNSQYKEIGFDGFEDYDFLPTSTNPLLNETTVSEAFTHFDFSDLIANNSVISRTDSQSHSGKYSLKIDGSNNATVNFQLSNQVVETEELDCGITGSGAVINGLSGAECKLSDCGDNASCSVRFPVSFSQLGLSNSYTAEVVKTGGYGGVSIQNFVRSGETASAQLVWSGSANNFNPNFEGEIRLLENGFAVDIYPISINYSSYYSQLDYCGESNPNPGETLSLTLVSPTQGNGNCYAQIWKVTNGAPNQSISYEVLGGTSDSAPFTAYVNNGPETGNLTLDSNGELTIEFEVCSDGENGVFNLEIEGNYITSPLKWM